MKTEASFNAIAITPVAGEWQVAINVGERTALIPFLLEDHARSFAAEHARRLGFVENFPRRSLEGEEGIIETNEM
jgi:hypothetical protein